MNHQDKIRRQTLALQYAQTKLDSRGLLNIEASLLLSSICTLNVRIITLQSNEYRLLNQNIKG